MGVSAIDISSEAFADVVRQMDLMGVAFIGSEASDGPFKTVRLLIEGECVPDAALVTGIIHKEQTAEHSLLKLTFERVE